MSGELKHRTRRERGGKMALSEEKKSKENES